MRGSSVVFERARPFGMERADFVLTCVGGALAVGLSVVAGVMILQKDRDEPTINGAEHLALFARPATFHDERERIKDPAPIAPQQAARITPRDPAIDYAPTAAIALAPPNAAARSSRVELPRTPRQQVSVSRTAATNRATRGNASAVALTTRLVYRQRVRLEIERIRKPRR